MCLSGSINVCARLHWVKLMQQPIAWGKAWLRKQGAADRKAQVTAHFVIFPDGRVAQLHPTSARLLASHGFNERSVAIEFAGNLRSTNGK